MQSALMKISNVALREGVYFGVILGIVQVIVYYVGSYTILSFIVPFLLIITELVVYLMAGIQASKQTGRIIVGTLAGLWTGIFNSAIFAIFSFVYTLLSIDLIRNSLQTTANRSHQNIHYTNQMVIQIDLTGILFTVVLSLVFGTALGAVGGIFGRGRPHLWRRQTRKRLLSCHDMR